MRMFLPVSGHIEGATCNCKNKPSLDATGHHLASQCPKRRTSTDAHDAIKYATSELMKYGGIDTRVEASNLFDNVDEKLPLLYKLLIYI